MLQEGYVYRICGGRVSPKRGGGIGSETSCEMDLIATSETVFEELSQDDPFAQQLPAHSMHFTPISQMQAELAAQKEEADAMYQPYAASQLQPHTVDVLGIITHCDAMQSE